MKYCFVLILAELATLGLSVADKQYQRGKILSGSA